MTNIEKIKLAIKVSDELYSKFGDRGTIKLMAKEYIDALDVILEEYDITAKADSNKKG